MLEQVDSRDLGSRAARRGVSNTSTQTKLMSASHNLDSAEDF